MSKKGKKDIENFRDLRERAEDFLLQRKGSLKPQDNYEDIHALIHDLQVHQIELELQNEELRSSRNELEKARDEYAKLYNQAPIGYISLDKNGIIKRANQTFLDIFSISSEEVIGKGFAEFLQEEDKNTFLGRYGALFRQPEGKSMIIKPRLKEKQIILQLNARRENQGDTLLVTLQDITERIEAEAKIQTLLEEKQLLLKEVHHRIKNHLHVVTALLSLQAEKAQNPEVQAALKDAINRIYSTLIIYDHLYKSEDFRKVSASQYLTQLLASLKDQFDSIHVAIHPHIEGKPLEPRFLLNLGMIINELVTNAFKYAFPDNRDGNIRVTFTRTPEGNYRLTVKDNGVGLPPSFNKEKSGQFGFTLVNALVQQLSGSMEIRNHEGAEITITFPAPEQVSA